MPKLNLRLRLLLGFTLLMLLIGGFAAILSWIQTRHNINALFDTQQMLFASRLAAIDPQNWQQNSPVLPSSPKLSRHQRGEFDDDALAFAIFSRDGKMILNDGENGRDFIFDYQQNGFTDSRLRDDDDTWRLVWLATKDHRYVVVVGQEWDYRQDMTLDIVKTNLIPWLAGLPVLLVLLFWLLSYELAPLRRITARLHQRNPDDGTPLNITRMPQEVQPLVTALNQLFIRHQDSLLHERRFTSDAAHELRSPLAALKVQAEVAQLAQDDAAVRQHALTNLGLGIDRASRLVDQLLTLSRLDAGAAVGESVQVHWQPLLQQLVIEHYSAAQAGRKEIALDAPTSPVITQGNSLLLALLVRNLLDNAIRYCHSGGTITLTLTNSALHIADDGPGVDNEVLERLGERFFRPPGQEQSGSGLGLSIVKNIARLHGIQTRFANRPEGGFIATLSW
ncbi:histidine kinase [Dickeya chrysanthemi Ech1591]|uniref:Sensor protein QseC n=1 Tax=Dickeya chrysanthemi (strain Ech1591) TaxID=561229 RepID=C6CQV7_DICC1|nr:quorum sensing histidine kinase QseC [Dickeya chrysanthemi]ACT08974.1 histidine kinase [Dickeya chrysanthemi Ech1591]WJM84965.1 quorum sensing histidine kinase QseC [Dickeya chrysanthemi]